MDLALFDFDGTITRVETFPAFVRMATPRWRRWIGGLALAPLVAGYRAGVLSGVHVRAAVVRVAFAGRDAAGIDACGARFAAVHVPPLLRPEAMARIAWHRARGDRVIVVSANVDAVLRPWCEAHGLEVLCSSLERRDGRLTGRYDGAQCAGEEKARRVRATVDLSAYGRIHAYGDTIEDAAMFALAHETHWRRMPAAA